MRPLGVSPFELGARRRPQWRRVRYLRSRRCTSEFLLYFVDANGRNDPVLAIGEPVVSFWDCSNPLHCEILHRQEERAEVASGDFDIVR